jgi:hypothetical protein
MGRSSNAPGNGTRASWRSREGAMPQSGSGLPGKPFLARSGHVRHGAGKADGDCGPAIPVAGRSADPRRRWLPASPSWLARACERRCRGFYGLSAFFVPLGRAKHLAPRRRRAASLPGRQARGRASFRQLPGVMTITVVAGPKRLKANSAPKSRHAHTIEIASVRSPIFSTHLVCNFARVRSYSNSKPTPNLNTWREWTLSGSYIFK